MGKIGNFEYPEMRINDAIELIKTFKERLNGETNNFDALAGLWGHKSPRSGAFLQKVADLRKYGLIAGRGEIKTTPLAEAIIYPKDENELNLSLRQMIFNIELWQNLYNRLGGNPPSDDFWVILQEVTGASRGIAQGEAGKISKLYMDIVAKIRAEVIMPLETRMEIHAPPSAQDQIEVRIGDFFLKTKKTDSNIKLLITALNDMLEKPESKPEKKGKSK